MAKSTVASSAAARTAEELKGELRGLVKAIADEDDARPETFEGASRALRDLRLCSARKTTGLEPAPAPPEHFLCPISSEIMKDPVVLASGQTYDRPFIQEWLNSGNRTCPQTQQVLTSPALTPNHLVRSMISQWCSEHGVTLPAPAAANNPDDPPIAAAERTSVNSLLKNLSSPSPPVKKQAVKDLRLLTKQKTSVRAYIGQSPDAIPRLLSVPASPGLDGDAEVQEDAVTTMLNLSIFDANKKVIGDDPEAIPFLIGAVRTGRMQARGNAAAALFSLSALDSNKVKIGEMGAARPLIELLEHSAPEAKKDAANALFNLCTNGENRARAVRDGVTTALMSAITDRVLVGEMLAILALVAGHRRAAEEVVEMDGVACLLEMIRDCPCPRNKENAMVVLYSICVDHRMKLREVGEEETLWGTISDVVTTGTSRARRKATGILERIRKTMHNTHYSC